jgi:hypothetical protein
MDSMNTAGCSSLSAGITSAPGNLAVYNKYNAHLLLLLLLLPA